MALVPLSSEETVVGTAIQEFTDGLQSRLPKPLNTPDFFQFYDDVMLNEVIKEEEKKALDRFGHDHALFNKFSAELGKVIARVVTSNEYNLAHSNMYLKELAKNVCDHFQASVEAKIFSSSGLENEMVAMEDYMDSLMTSKVDDFRLSWGHLNLGICDELTDMLKERKDKLVRDNNMALGSGAGSSSSVETIVIITEDGQEKEIKIIFKSFLPEPDEDETIGGGYFIPPLSKSSTEDSQERESTFADCRSSDNDDSSLEEAPPNTTTVVE